MNSGLWYLQHCNVPCSIGTLRPTFINSLFPVLYKATNGRLLLKFIILFIMHRNEYCTATSKYLLHWQKLFITFQIIWNYNNIKPAIFFCQKTNQQTTGLHHTALQYRTEVADSYVQIHAAKNISSQPDNWEYLQIFWNT